MSKYDDFKCFIGLHNINVYKEETLTNIKGNIIGKIIINRCENCGKIKHIEVKTVDERL